MLKSMSLHWQLYFKSSTTEFILVIFPFLLFLIYSLIWLIPLYVIKLLSPQLLFLLGIPLSTLCEVFLSVLNCHLPANLVTLFITLGLWFPVWLPSHVYLSFTFPQHPKARPLHWNTLLTQTGTTYPRGCPPPCGCPPYPAQAVIPCAEPWGPRHPPTPHHRSLLFLPTADFFRTYLFRKWSEEKWEGRWRKANRKYFKNTLTV